MSYSIMYASQFIRTETGITPAFSPVQTTSGKRVTNAGFGIGAASATWSMSLRKD